MYPIRYYDIYRDSSNPFNLRVKMVQMALSKGVSQAAREYGTTRKTVRKWKRRYEERGVVGLKDQSKAPKHIPHKTSSKVEERVVELRNRFPTFGQDRLRNDFDLPCSSWAINRILNQHGLIKKRRRKHRTKRRLWKVKKKLRPFQKIQIDTKELRDIPEYLPHIVKEGFPSFQYTARDLKSGAQFLAFSSTNDSTNASIFASVVGNQLRKYEIDLSEVTFQTDNGSEYVNSSRLKHHLPTFTVTSEKLLGIKEHYRIPPGMKTWQSDVETVHRLIEDEFYRIEEFGDLTEFLGKAYAYQLYFNFKRRNSNKDSKAPVELLEEDYPNINPNVLNLPPVLLETILEDYEEPKYYLEEKKLEEEYANMGLTTEHGYLLPYVLSGGQPDSSGLFSTSFLPPLPKKPEGSGCL